MQQKHKPYPSRNQNKYKWKHYIYLHHLIENTIDQEKPSPVKRRKGIAWDDKILT